jgi:excisionase family DNA binding protein
MSINCLNPNIVSQVPHDVLNITNVWFDSEEAAKYLAISVGTLRNLSSNGCVPYYKFGKRNRYLKSELHELLMKEPRGTRND